MTSSPNKCPRRAPFREPKGVAQGIVPVLLSQDLGQSSPNPRLPQMAEHTAQQSGAQAQSSTSLLAHNLLEWLTE